jgi:two-component system, sensor histidine kinase and response regulator
VALACELPFDLVLMDLQMPILDGLRATAAIRRFESRYARPAVPVLAYSSSFPAGDLMAKFGISGCLNKPCQDQDLDACLARWCPAYRSAPAWHAAVRCPT